MEKEVRTIKVGDRVLEYSIRTSHLARRTIIKITKVNRLEVVVPRGLPLSVGEDFLHSKREWIAKHLPLLDPSKRKYFYKGKEYKLVHSKSAARRTHLIRLEGDSLIIESPAQTKMEPYDLYMEFLKRNGKGFLTERCIELAKQNGFSPEKITVRGQRTRWGSCSRRKTISINYKLMQLPPEAIDYVLIHELCHLRHMDHSKKFWAEVAQYIPDYKRLDKLVNKFRT